MYFGLLLSLSEKTKPVFVISTANNIELLPLEIIRKGRFDEIFFLDLPRKEEREEIFKIHLQEFRPDSWKSFDYPKLAQLSESFSGAEIRQSIIEGMYLAFYEKREVTTDDICLALKELIPLAERRSELLQKAREKKYVTAKKEALESVKNRHVSCLALHTSDWQEAEYSSRGLSGGARLEGSLLR